MRDPNARPRMPATVGEPLLEVNNLSTYFDTLTGPARSVDGVSFTVRAGQTLGVVGESGCGKSVTALSILRLLPTPPAHVRGSVALRGVDLLRLSEREMRSIRGNRISMIFQEPMTSLNPVLTIGRQIAETVQLHEKASRAEALGRAVQMLQIVQIPEPKRRVSEYPHQLSGGMRQRVMIALALACRPEVLIADEPTTALDVTIQAQILDLVRRLQKELGMGVVMITHDLGVVAESCDRVVVMYAGRKVEEADVLDLFDRPSHPYTRALMASMPSMNTRSERLTEIPGLVPSPQSKRRGCLFAARCSYAQARCHSEIPQLLAPLGASPGTHVVACFAVEEGRIDSRAVHAPHSAAV
jgi:peptide/nickel transport system ATP-binding protein